LGRDAAVADDLRLSALACCPLHVAPQTREPGPGVTLVAAGATIAKAITVCELLRRLVPSLSVLTQLRSAAVPPLPGTTALPRPPLASSPRRAAVATPAIVITLAADLSDYRGEPG